MNRWLPVLLVLTTWLARPAPAWACTCALPDTPAVTFRQAEAVFAGRVTRIVDPWQNPLVANVLSQVPILAARFNDTPVTLQVTDSWKGVATTTVTLDVGLKMCGFPFTLGGDYVVYAYRDGGGWTTNSCTRTKAVAQATDDLNYLQTLPRLALTPAPISGGPLVFLGLALVGVLAVGGVAWKIRRRANKVVELS